MSLCQELEYLLTVVRYFLCYLRLRILIKVMIVMRSNALGSSITMSSRISAIGKEPCSSKSGEHCFLLLARSEIVYNHLSISLLHEECKFHRMPRSIDRDELGFTLLSLLRLCALLWNRRTCVCVETRACAG